VEPTETAEPEVAPEHAEGGDFGLVGALLAAGLFVSLFLPWYVTLSAWGLRVGDEAGLLALAVVLVELVRLMGSWRSHAAGLVAFCLTAAAGIMGITTFVVLRWGSGTLIKFSTFRYGAWLGLAAGILLVVVAAAESIALRRTAS
jgi:hypothetical protein